MTFQKQRRARVGPLVFKGKQKSDLLLLKGTEGATIHLAFVKGLGKDCDLMSCFCFKEGEMDRQRGLTILLSKERMKERERERIDNLISKEKERVKPILLHVRRKVNVDHRLVRESGV